MDVGRGEGQQSANEEYSEDHDANCSDRVGNLPDAVLHHVLSLLPIRDAVRTSLLSKRWQYLWFSIPKLVFHEHEFPKRSIFMNFVERTLVLYNLPSVEEFFLSCKVGYDVPRIYSWISAAVKRQVRELCLELRLVQQPGPLPPCLFRCETLVKLKLDMPCELIMPSSVSLTSLKDMTLKFVRFIDQDSVQKLFSCPALETLFIDGCIWIGPNCVTISAPKLQRLSIDDACDSEEIEYYLPPYHCQVVIDGPSLKFLNYHGGLLNGYCLSGTSSLVKAMIDAFDIGPTVDEYLPILLAGLCNVERLTLHLSEKLFKCVAREHDTLWKLPTFSNLTELNLKMLCVYLDSKLLATLLRRSPHLRILDIAFRLSMSEDSVATQVLEPAPSCFELQLKKIVVHHFVADEVGLCCIALLLRKAMVLEEMVLHNSKAFLKDPAKGDYSFLENLKNLPRGSRRCTVSLIL